MKWACVPFASFTARSAIDTFGRTTGVTGPTGVIGVTGVTGSVGVVARSVIDPAPEPSTSVAPDGVDSVTVKVSLASAVASPLTMTAMVLLVSPGANVTVPVEAM